MSFLYSGITALLIVLLVSILVYEVWEFTMNLWYRTDHRGYTRKERILFTIIIVVGGILLIGVVLTLIVKLIYFHFINAIE